MKYKNDDERKQARRKQNNEAQKRCRAKKAKLTQQVPAKVMSTVSFDDTYINALITECAKYPFNFSLTLTNKKRVTGNMHNKAAKALLHDLSKLGYVTNFIRINEHDGFNYHGHCVFQSPYDEKFLTEYLRKNWGSGFFRLKSMDTDEYRLNAIRYIFKQLKPTSNSAITQFLIDTWEFVLVKPFNSLKQAKMPFLGTYKKDNGLDLPIDFSKYNFKSFVTDILPNL